MGRVNIFAKGNVDVHDSLHSCRIDGSIVWNGINPLVRSRFPDVSVRVKHETFTRSDALLAQTGRGEADLFAQDFDLGAYPLASQFSRALFETDADAYVLSIQADLMTALFEHRDHGFLFYPNDYVKWPKAQRDWISAQFKRLDLLTVEQSMQNLKTIVGRLQAASDAPVLIYNVSSVVPHETISCYLGLGETWSARARAFNLELLRLSAETGVAIIDVDTIVARAGADRVKVDGIHLNADGYRLVAEHVVDVLDELGVFQ